MKKIYFFGPGCADGDATMKNLLGSKGANLAELARLAIPLPAGFTIPTTECVHFLQNNFELRENFMSHISDAMKRLEAMSGRKFAHMERPLLVSVRSGAAVSMPGMMETVLNLGINDEVVEALSVQTGNRWFAFDTYRRFLQMYMVAVEGMDSLSVDQPLANLKMAAGLAEDTDLSVAHLETLVRDLKRLYREKYGKDFPEDPFVQLLSAIKAIFRSWNCSRAQKYRRIHGIADDLGTAVNICAMVYGNRGHTSGTGVCFTRDPSTGERTFYGEYLLNAQGEDVVSGVRTPKPLSCLREEMPDVYRQLEEISSRLERHYRDLQDLEFTIEDGNLYLLQARMGKRTARAAFKIAVDMVNEGIISKQEAIGRVEPFDFERLLLPSLDPRAHKQVIGRGLAASPGAASGQVVFHALDAERLALQGKDVILVREETSPEDIGGVHAARGLLTTRGGMTSHAAIVARQMGKCCVAGCGNLQVLSGARILRAGSLELKEGEWITLDGSTGEVMLGKVATRDAVLDRDFATFLEWARGFRRVQARVNADNGRDAAIARRLGAEGVGLFRTERLFFEKDALPVVRRAVLARTSLERAHALANLKDFQKQSFVEILEAMEGYDVSIRLFDHPLIEFLPRNDEDTVGLSSEMQISPEELSFRIKSLMQTNPSLGHRGCRLGVTYPEIYEMQIQALVEATGELLTKGMDVRPQMMLPFVSMASELAWARRRFDAVFKKFAAVEQQNRNIVIPRIPLGVMIETPRAALIADKLVADADFFCIGTMDLTQLIYGLSREDAAPFLRVYKQERILEEDPMAVLDEEGVLFFVRMACEKARKVKPDFSIGLCTEHHVDQNSSFYAPDLNLDYISCSSFRVPMTILSSARTALRSSSGR